MADIRALCHKVTAAIDAGRVLQDGPTHACTAANGVMRGGRAVVKQVDGNYAPDITLGEL